MRMRICFLILAALALAAPSFGGALTPGTWYSDQWSGTVGTWVTDYFGYTGTAGTVLIDPLAAPWTFSGPGNLFVTDMYIDGDQFAIFDNGVLVGDTSAPQNDGADCGNDPLTCTSSSWTHGTFYFGAGDHSITMQVIAEANCCTDGAAAFGFDVVPEPVSFLLAGVGCLGLLALHRMRR